MKRFSSSRLSTFMMSCVPEVKGRDFMPSDLVFLSLDEAFRVMRVWQLDENCGHVRVDVDKRAIGAAVFGQLLPFHPITLAVREGSKFSQVKTDLEFCSITHLSRKVWNWSATQDQEGGENKMAIIVHKKANADQADKAPATRKAPAKKAEKAPAKKAEKAPAKKAEAEGAGEGEE